MLSFSVPDLRRLETTKSDVIALFRFVEMTPLKGITSLVDWRLHGHLSRMTIEGFLTGEVEPPMLIPLGRLLPHQFLVVIGLGRRDEFGEARFRESVLRTFNVIKDLKTEGVTLALPGRVENACRSSEAIEWFIEMYTETNLNQEVVIIEPIGAQKTMLPAIERWRLKSLIPKNYF